MDEQEQPRDDDNGEWAYQLELEQQFYEEVINHGISKSRKKESEIKAWNFGDF